MPVRPLLAIALAAALAAPGAAAAAPTRPALATVAAPAPVAASADVVAWSAYDPATHAYALTVSAGGQVRTPAVPTRSVPFDVDAGPGPGGTTWLVYSRCAREAKGRRPARGCDLYGLPLAAGAAERRIAAADTSANETQPAIDGDRIGFARAAARRGAGAAVYTAPVQGAGRATRVRGAIPSRTCETVGGGCVAIRGAQVAGLDLAGFRVAVVSTWPSTGSQAVGLGQTALVVASTARRSATPVAFAVSGLDDQSLLGPSFAGGAVSWFYGCPGYAGGCGGPLAGAWRWSPGTRRYRLAASRAAVESYAALPGGAAVELLAGAGTGCGIGLPSATQPCSIVRTGPLRFRPAKGRPLPVRLAG